MPYPQRIDNGQLDAHALCYRTQGTKNAGDCASAAATDPTSSRSAPTPPYGLGTSRSAERPTNTGLDGKPGRPCRVEAMHAYFGNYFLCSIAFCETKPEQRNHVQLRGVAQDHLSPGPYSVTTWEMAMDRNELPRTEPRDATPREDETTRNEAHAHYDAGPGIAVLLLAVMAFLFIVATYQFLTDRLEDPVGRDKRVQIEVPKAPSQ
jgi:hypothetical protein